MATKIGSFFYEIFADSSKLSKDLKDSKSKVGKFAAGFKELTGVSLGAASALALAGQAIKKISDFIRESVTATDAYVSSMTDMSRMTGINIEDMSRLAQAADDLFISQDQLNTALTAAGRKGIDTSIEGLKDLSRQYLALGTAAEKAKFLAENFGRSGMAMGKLLEVGADGIDAATAAISDNLIVTEEAQKITYEYKRSMDALSDSFAGLKYQVGLKVMPVISDFSLVASELIDTTSQWNTENNGLINGLRFLWDRLNPFAPALQNIRGIVGELADKMRETNPEIDSMADSISGVGAAATLSAEQVASSMMSMASSISGVEEDYKTSLQEIADNEELTAEERIAAIQSVEDAHEMATNKIVLGYAEQILAVDGLTQEEARALIQQGIDWGIYEENTLDVLDSVISRAGDLSASINAIPSEKTIMIKTIYKTEGGLSKHASSDSYWQSAISGPVISAGGASGLDMVVPPGYPNDSFLVAASSGENVNIGRGDSNNNDLVAAIQSMDRKLENLPLAMRDSMLFAMGQ